jgi:hypothetical protein
VANDVLVAIDDAVRLAQGGDLNCAITRLRNGLEATFWYDPDPGGDSPRAPRYLTDAIDRIQEGADTPDPDMVRRGKLTEGQPLVTTNASGEQRDYSPHWNAKVEDFAPWRRWWSQAVRASTRNACVGGTSTAASAALRSRRRAVPRLANIVSLTTGSLPHTGCSEMTDAQDGRC